MLVSVVAVELGRLVQVSGHSAICSNDTAVFWCTSGEFIFLNMEIRIKRLTLALFFGDDDPVESTMSGTLNSSLVVGQVTFYNGSFVNATVTIKRPINLNGSTITCNRDTLTLTIPTRSGKFLLLTCVGITLF